LPRWYWTVWELAVALVGSYELLIMIIRGAQAAET
jgi:hypothetical protein